MSLIATANLIRQACMLKPLVKNPGGKRRVAPIIVDQIIDAGIEFGGYHEPMFGAGAIFCELHNRGLLQKKRTTIADQQPAIIDMLVSIKGMHWETNIANRLAVLLKQYSKDSEAVYYRIRDRWNAASTSSGRKSSDFIFLKQTSFNGLWRENLKGKMNAPWGKYKKPSLPTRKELKLWHEVLCKTVIRHQDFEKIYARTKANDLVYFDPPYWGAFDKFSAKGFSEDDQIRLMKFCLRLMRKGVHVVYSNVKNPAMFEHLDKEWLSKASPSASVGLFSFPDTRAISGYTKARKPKEELLVIGRA